MFFGLWSFGVWNFVFGTWFPLTAPASLSFKFKFKTKHSASRVLRSAILKLKLQT